MAASPDRPQVESSTEEHRSATSPFNDVAGGALMLLEIGYWDVRNVTT
jgi:hypothetical protein